MENDGRSARHFLTVLAALLVSMQCSMRGPACEAAGSSIAHRRCFWASDGAGAASKTLQEAPDAAVVAGGPRCHTPKMPARLIL